MENSAGAVSLLPLEQKKTTRERERERETKGYKASSPFPVFVSLL